MLFKIVRDDVSPELSRLARLAANPTPIFRAMGNAFKSITEGTFNSVGAAYRPAPWPAKRDGTPSNLQASTTLAHSFVLEVTPTGAKVSVQGGAAQYAAIHQFGGTITAKGRALTWIGPDGKRIFAHSVKMPARPFFPVIDGQLTPAAAEKIKRAGERAILRQEQK